MEPNCNGTNLHWVRPLYCCYKPGKLLFTLNLSKVIGAIIKEVDIMAKNDTFFVKDRELLKILYTATEEYAQKRKEEGADNTELAKIYASFGLAQEYICSYCTGDVLVDPKHTFDTSQRR